MGGGEQAAQRDAEWGAAAAARFPNGSELGAARDAAELDYSRRIAAIGARLNTPSLPWSLFVAELVYEAPLSTGSVVGVVKRRKAHLRTAYY